MQDLDKLLGRVEDNHRLDLIVSLAIAEQTSRLADAVEGILTEMKRDKRSTSQRHNDAIHEQNEARYRNG